MERPLGHNVVQVDVEAMGDEVELGIGDLEPPSIWNSERENGSH